MIDNLEATLSVRDKLTDVQAEKLNELCHELQSNLNAILTYMRRIIANGVKVAGKEHGTEIDAMIRKTKSDFRQMKDGLLYSMLRA